MPLGGVMTLLRTTIVVLMTLTAFGAAAQNAGPNPGRAIAASCANCHGTNGVSVGTMPSLAGVAKADLVSKMQEFKTGKRTGTVMPQLAKGFSDEQIDQVAAWFAAPPAR
jgi:cytochrome subunit of sulfide dehydrogenase